MSLSDVTTQRATPRTAAARGGEEAELTAADSVRERLLDAAERCYRRFGRRKTTVDDVARAAHLSRATVYRYFKNRDELLLGVVAREAFRLAADAERYLTQFDDVGSWIVEGLLFSLREIPGRAALSNLFDSDDGTSRIVLSSPELLEIGAAVLRPMFEPARQRGLLREHLRMDMLIEWVLRILASYLTAPSRLAPTEPELRRVFRAMILPAVVRTEEASG